MLNSRRRIYVQRNRRRLLFVNHASYLISARTRSFPKPTFS